MKYLKLDQDRKVKLPVHIGVEGIFVPREFIEFEYLSSDQKISIMHSELVYENWMDTSHILEDSKL